MTVQHPEDYTLCSAQPRDLLQRQHFLKLFFRTAVVLQAIHKVKSSNMMNLRVFISSIILRFQRKSKFNKTVIQSLDMRAGSNLVHMNEFDEYKERRHTAPVSQFIRVQTKKLWILITWDKNSLKAASNDQAN